MCNYFASKCKLEAIHAYRNMEEESTDLYEDALINTMQVNTVQSDVLFAVLKVKKKKISFQIYWGECSTKTCDSNSAISVIPTEAASIEQCH